MAASQCLFLLDASLHRHRAPLGEATTTGFVAFVLVLVYFMICILKKFADRTGLADKKNTSVAQSTGLATKILHILSSCRLPLSVERFAFVVFWSSASP